jgi:hypothetical protein
MTVATAPIRGLPRLPVRPATARAHRIGEIDPGAVAAVGVDVAGKGIDGLRLGSSVARSATGFVTSAATGTSASAMRLTNDELRRFRAGGGPVGKQVLVPADRGVDAHPRRALAFVLGERVVDVLAHAVEPLELERSPAARALIAPTV